jgi:MoxR-like ATPase
LDIFKLAYKVRRINSDEIYNYNGFDFKHLTDATEHYVNPFIKSASKRTTLCQPIGEALSLFMAFDKRFSKKGGGAVDGEYLTNADGSQSLLTVTLPGDWRDNGVVEPEIHRYDALYDNGKITIAAYDSAGEWIEGDMDHLHPLYKLLPCFCLLFAREYLKPGNQSIDYVWCNLNHEAKDFVKLHEDFYQAHKSDEYEIAYADLSGRDTTDMLPYRAWLTQDSAAAQAQEQEQEQEQDIARFPDDAFPEDLKGWIPSLPEEFETPKAVRGICSAVTNADARSVLFHGPAGTGKTMSCKLVCQEIGLPLIAVVNCTDNLDDLILGKYIPEGDGFVFNESRVTKAIRDGGAVVFEEINFAKPQCLAFLNSLLDDNGFVWLDNNEVVRRHPDFRFFATMNMGYAGTRDLNHALYNRFNLTVEINALPDEVISRMLVARVPGCKPVVKKMLGVYGKIRKKIEGDELDAVISPRNLENWARQAQYEGYVTAAERTIIPIARCDRSFEKAIRGIIALYKWE